MKDTKPVKNTTDKPVLFEVSGVPGAPIQKFKFGPGEVMEIPIGYALRRKNGPGPTMGSICETTTGGALRPVSELETEDAGGDPAKNPGKPSPRVPMSDPSDSEAEPETRRETPRAKSGS